MKYFFLILFSATINFISWNYFGILFIFNLIVLFYIAESIQNLSFLKKIIILLSYYICFNISATFWLFDVDTLDAILSFFSNSIFFLMFSIPLFFKKIKMRFLWFILFWMIGEIALTKWDLSFPWLNFGNVLGNQWYLIQWYSFFGVYSGSLWLLLISLVIFKLNKNKKYFLYLILLTALPFLSIFNYLNWNNDIHKNKVEKYTSYIPQKKYSNYSKTKKLYNYIVKNRIDNTIISTELFYTNLYSDYLENSDFSLFYKQLLKNNDNLKFILGTEIINNDTIKFNGISYFSKDYIYFRTKKKYVPGNEFITPVLRPVFGKSYYIKNNSDDASKILNSLNTIPFVCYESIFSDFVASFNSDKIIVLTSEAFLGDNNFGKRQYQNIQRIRAIENNRYLLKSSFNGYSCIINPKGKIIRELKNEFNNISIPTIQSKTLYQKIIQFL
jgi:apolipoprotein N-acyltransferase